MASFFSAPFLCIAHRGASAEQPENTLAAFERAVTLGAHAIELDVRLVEGSLVVLHDTHVARTTNGWGRLEQYTLAALRALDAGAGQRVPLLDEVLDAVGDGVGINIELKGAGTAEAAVAQLRAQRIPAEGILLSSFDLTELAAAAAAGPEFARGALFHGRLNRGLVDYARSIGAAALNVARGLVSDALLAEARAAALPLLVYTVNDPTTIADLARRGASGVFTDDPAAWRTAMASNTERSQ